MILFLSYGALFIMFVVARDYGRVHARATARLLPVCYWCTEASAWWFGSAESKIDHCEKGMVQVI